MASSSDVEEVEEVVGELATSPTKNIQIESQPMEFLETIANRHDGQKTSERGKDTLYVQNNFASGNAIQINAPIDRTQLFDLLNKRQSLFGSLAVEPPQNLATSDTARKILAKKVAFQAGRTQHENPDGYAPYAVVKNRKIKNRLFQIAQRLQFLDRGFAEYFQVVVPSYDQDHVRQLLHNARKSIASRQNRNPHNENVSEAIYLGDLGHFCEEVSRSWSQPIGQNPVFTVTHGRNEILRYLQDALEVPYWEFMIDLFLGWRANSKALSGDVVLHVLDNVKLDVLDGKCRVLNEIENLKDNLTDKEKEDILLILKGIDARIQVLESVWDETTSNIEKDDSLISLFEKTPKLSTTTVEEQLRQVQDETSSQNETAILIALILIFLIGAIVPGCKAFAISMQTSSPGSYSDADFWYLIQSSIMAILGNIVMVVPLLKKSWFSPGYSLMWTFFALNLAFAIISIIIYPLLNTGWSSMVSFFGSIASVASVLVMTQATSKEVNRGKVKTD